MAGQSIYSYSVSGCLCGVADFLSVHLFKNYFKRLRPCHSLDDAPVLICWSTVAASLIYFQSCYQSYGYGSIPVFIDKEKVGTMELFVDFWAILIGFAQVFVGVHYPLDVLVGFLFGGAVGLAFYQLMNNFFRRLLKK
ncbi:MAG: phosphatase PAP2 family protein [Candidatus Parvibacillus calidus]|nr:MAG: phosphatase PAP2 family protein [Candidatus Parvibacillus calidus]